jgi:sn-glycerol 3-phosphate transport system permease protein
MNTECPPQETSKPGWFSSIKGYLLVAPAVILLCVFTIWPIFFLLKSSLYDGSLLSVQRNFLGLGNYTALFKSIDFKTVFLNTIIYTAGLVIIVMIISTLLAVFLNRKGTPRLNSLTMAAIFTPHIISLVSVSSIFLWIMDPENGIINYIIKMMGFTAFPFLADSGTALFSLILMMTWKSLGYYTLLILAAVQSVPKELYEAAAIDRANPVRVFFRITLPMISPTLFFTTIVSTIYSFQVFDPVNLMTKGGPANSTNTLVYKIYSDAFKYLNLGKASAECVILLLFISILTVIYFTFLSKKVFYR